jgi:PAS domain-containing protein
MCGSCADGLCAGAGTPLRDFLDSLGPPVLLIGPEVRMRDANRAACGALGKELPEISGRCGGEVMNCVHAREPGGCGGTAHCESCVIRKTVLATFATGKACSGVSAFPDLEADGIARGMRMRFSTEKVGSCVMLMVHELVEAAGVRP